MPKLPVETALQKLNRVRRMPAAETFYRIVEKARSELERARTLLGVAGASVSCTAARNRSFLDELRAGPALRFYFNPAARLRIFQFIAREFPEWIEAAEQDANRIAQHRVQLLGYGEVHLGEEIDWHRDPITGKRWPRRFWTDYDPVRECSAGDPKTIHELNRHAHLPRLAKAYFLTAEERYATEAVSQLMSWIDQNPPSLGINWQSSLEIALRCIAWMWTLFFLLPSRALSEESALRIARSLFAQLEHVSRYPSIYSSPNTHLLGEATALFLAGALFREHRRSSDWLKQGSTLLVGQMYRQTTPDGVHIELSTYYHCYTVDFYLQAMILAQRNSLAMPRSTWDMLSRMIEFLQHVAAPDGSIPKIGDDDGGRALTLSTDSYTSFLDAFSTGAVLFGREDFKQSSRGLREETFWLLGEDALSLYSKLQAESAGHGEGAFPDAGYFVQRSDWSDRADRLIFDCGGLGKPSGGHGHSDALSITLAVRGRELLVDPGTFIYNTAPRWRDFFRSTRAHNTVVVDGRDQSEPGQTFRWKSAATARLERSCQAPLPGYVEGEHNGYGRLSEPVVHRRRVLHTGTYWAIVDDFRGRGEHSFELNFHFAPSVRIRMDPAGEAGLPVICENGQTGLAISITGSSPVQFATVQGQERPLQGWVSSRYGQREAAPVLIARMNSGVPAIVLTCLFPLDIAEHGNFTILPEVVQLPSAPDVMACEVRGQDVRDTIIFAAVSNAETTFDERTVRGEFFWLRERDGRLLRAFGTQARTLIHRGERILETGDPRVLHYSAEGDCVPPGSSEGKHTCAEFAEL